MVFVYSCKRYKNYCYINEISKWSILSKIENIRKDDFDIHNSKENCKMIFIFSNKNKSNSFHNKNLYQ